MQIADHNFLVTGGGSGLGAATARHLVAEGGFVVLADIDESRARAEAEQLGERALAIQTDVTQETDAQRAVQFAVERRGGLHGLVSCAGILGGGRVVGREGPHPLDDFRRVIEVNLIGVFNVLRLAAAAMVENEPNDEGERGVLINTASVAAMEGQIGQAAYSASKGGVAGMTLPIARELARFGIRVVAMAPGVFLTPMMEATPDKLRDSLAAQVPFPPRLGSPSEFAALAAHIIQNPYLNGTMLRIDGALRMEAK